MKEINAIIRPEKFDKISRELRKEGFCCMTVLQGEGIGRHSDAETASPTLEFPVLHSHIVKIEMMVTDEEADRVCSIIQEYGSTGQKGDGIITVSELNEVVSIRSGENGSVAL